MAVEEDAGAVVPVDRLAAGSAMAGQVRKQASGVLTAGTNVLVEEGWGNCYRELPRGLAVLAAAVVAGAGWDCSNMRHSGRC